MTGLAGGVCARGYTGFSPIGHRPNPVLEFLEEAKRKNFPWPSHTSSAFANFFLLTWHVRYSAEHSSRQQGVGEKKARQLDQANQFFSRPLFFPQRAGQDGEHGWPSHRGPLLNLDMDHRERAFFYFLVHSWREESTMCKRDFFLLFLHLLSRFAFSEMCA